MDRSDRADSAGGAGIGRALADWRRHGSLEYFGDRGERGHKLFISEYGEGPPLLCLHGFPTSSFDYARLVPLLAPHRRLLLLDFLGYGYSDKPPEHRYSLFEQAAFAEELCLRRGYKEVDVLAHDMGTSVALVMLQRMRVKVSRLCLLNGSVLLKHYRPLITQRLLLHPIAGPLVTGLRLIRKTVFARQFSRLFPNPPPPEELDAFWSLIAHNAGPRIYHRLIRYLAERKVHELEWLDALVQSRAPLLLLWGQLDPVSRPEIAEAVAERRPDARYVRLHDLGHYPQWEDPARIASELLTLLRAPGAPASL